jgi:hypothetical protein
VACNTTGLASAETYRGVCGGSRQEGLNSDFRQFAGKASKAFVARSATNSHLDHISQKMSVVSEKMDNNLAGQTGFASDGVELF